VGLARPGLAPEDVAALEERTEGWTAALQLAALSLRGREDVGYFIARFAGTTGTSSTTWPRRCCRIRG